MGADAFTQHLLKVLRAHPQGISEHDLLKQLQADQQPGFTETSLRDNLGLFQTHFLLFNALYRLSDELAVTGMESLQIHTLKIQLLPSSPNNQTLPGTHDPLRDYYLDLSHLETTDEKAVEDLLTQFWARYLANDARTEALEKLDLQDPVDWHTIKQQHRKLAMQHHPDRGGDNERLQAINAAMSVLARAEGKS